MSRFIDYDGDEDYPNQWAMWEGRVNMALNGRRGRKALAELRDALVALPAPRLIESALCRPTIEDEKVVGGEVCVIGAYLWYQKVKGGMDPVTAFASLPELEARDDNYERGQAALETARAGRDAGLTYTLAYELAYMNDETLEGLTPEQRHGRFIEFLDQKLAEPLLTKAAPRKRRHRVTKAPLPRRSRRTPDNIVSLGL